MLASQYPERITRLVIAEASPLDLPRDDRSGPPPPLAIDSFTTVEAALAEAYRRQLYADTMALGHEVLYGLIRDLPAPALLVPPIFAFLTTHLTTHVALVVSDFEGTVQELQGTCGGTITERQDVGHDGHFLEGDFARGPHGYRSTLGYAMESEQNSKRRGIWERYVPPADPRIRAWVEAPTEKRRNTSMSQSSESTSETIIRTLVQETYSLRVRMVDVQKATETLLPFLQDHTTELTAGQRLALRMLPLVWPVVTQRIEGVLNCLHALPSE